MVGVADQLAPVLERLATFQPKLVFNGCESFRGHARHEYALATVLEMHGYRYTGSSPTGLRSEEHTSELQSLAYLVCRLLLEKKKKKKANMYLNEVNSDSRVKTVECQ